MKTPNEVFDGVYCINLKRRPDRLANFLKRINREGIDCKIIYGIDAIDDEVKILYEFHKNNIKRVGAFAILLTYIKLFEDVLENTNHQQILLFQDDVLFHKDFKTLFDTHYQNLPNDWDFWYLGATEYNDRYNYDKIDEYFHEASQTDGLFGFAIKRDFMYEVLKNWKKMNDHTDGSIRKENFDCITTPKLYVSEEKLCGHDTGFTDNYCLDITKEITEKYIYYYYDPEIYR